MIEASLPAAHVLHYGAGYPLTYCFDVPATPGLVAQKSNDGTAWADIDPAPSGRFDGVEVARFDGSTAYVSAAFDDGRNYLYLRVVDGSTDVGVFRGVAHYYDDRDAPVMFTYDDWRGQPESVGGAADHRAAQLWFTGGINSNLVTSWATIQDHADLGWFEPSNHGRNHMRPAQGDYDPDPEGIAYDEVVVGGQEIKANLNLPWQSRGNLHSWIRPGGEISAEQRAALSDAFYLLDRSGANLVYNEYPQWADDEMYELWGPTRRTIYYGEQTDHAAQADAMIADTASAIANRHGAHFYSYIHYWPNGPGSELQRALNAIGAHDNIWSVGWGHWGLYRRTAEMLRVTGRPYIIGVDRSRASGQVATVDIPPGEDGDLLIAIRFDTTLAAAQTAPAGWTLLGAASDELAVWWKIATAADTTVSLTGAQSDRFSDAVVIRCANVDTTDPIAGFARVKNTAAVVATAPATTTDGYTIRIFKATAARIQPPYAGTTRISRAPIATGSACSVVTEYATGGDEAAITPLSANAASVAATVVLNYELTREPEPPMTSSTNRRRAASVVGLI